ncbi:MAG: hypothetical protein HRJ53_12920 [Acidobacteria bacterium Pan2503]|uniref:Uncharacterized protein n=1 Tax=Candidatus Acidiferrum panamense TaxID=2741543 RepID=A0A7V8NR08_9BACT|nr:hypothetical protein [Candidatus Acidoferrum panamensis]
MPTPFQQPANPLTANAFTGVLGGPSFAVGSQPCVGVQIADVTLSSAQILALLSTPVTIIPAPGVTGWTIVPLMAIIRLIGGGAAYTDVGGAVSFNSGSASWALAANTIFLTTVSPNRAIQKFPFPNVLDTAANPPTDDNAALTISKITNNFAAGTGTCHITVYYVIDASL